MQFPNDDVASRRSASMRRVALTAAILAGTAFPALAGSVTGDGIASFYGRSEHGGPTASGERFNMNALTAAHRSAPLGSHLKVTNTRNGKSVVVRVNDRGPFVRGRIIDLSRAAAEQLGFVGAGLTHVRIEPAQAEAAAPIRVASADPETTGSVGSRRAAPVDKTAPGAQGTVRLSDAELLILRRN